MAVFKKVLCTGRVNGKKCKYWRSSLNEVTEEVAEGGAGYTPESSSLTSGGQKKVKGKTPPCPVCGNPVKAAKHYTIQWYEGGRKKTATLPGLTKQEAEGVLATKTTPAKLKQHVRVNPNGKVPFDQVADEYLDAEGFELKDAQRARIAISHLKAFFGGEHLSLITYTSIQKYKQRRLQQEVPCHRKEKPERVSKRKRRKDAHPPAEPRAAKKVSHATVGRELSVLRSIFAFAVKEKHLAKDDNPTTEVAIPNSRTIKRLLSKTQRESLFSQLSEAIRAFFLFMAVTGWRYSEVAKLTWEDLAQFASVAYQEDPKTCETRGEEVPRFLPGSAWAIIESQPKKCTHIFFNPKTLQPWGDLRASFRRAAIRAGLVYKDGSVFRPHDLRHDFASWGSKSGLGLHIIMALLGHKDPRSATRYIYTDNNHLQEACNILEKARGLKLVNRGKGEGKTIDLEGAKRRNVKQKGKGSTAASARRGAKTDQAKRAA